MQVSGATLSLSQFSLLVSSLSPSQLISSHARLTPAASTTMVSTGSVDRNVLTSSYHERVPSKHAKRGLKDLQQQPQQPYLPHHDHSGLAAAAAAGGPHLHLARKRSKLAGSATSSSLSSMASSQLGRPGQASASFNRGLFVAFIDNAFAERKRVSGVYLVCPIQITTIFSRHLR